MEVDVMVVRHSAPGSPHFLAKRLKASVINAGDGCHEHPTQALLDIMTIKKKFPSFKGLKIAIIGDIKHSRVSRSLILGLKKMGAKITVCAPPTLLPLWVEPFGVEFEYSLEKTLPGKDILYILRIQKERQAESFFPSQREYIKSYSLTYEKLKRFASKEVLIMHPGPINRGIEIESKIADSEYSLVLNQVTSGVAVRMSVLYLLTQRKLYGSKS
jgi:aspartate carbamoyltransferase catalytic subunit